MRNYSQNFLYCFLSRSLFLISCCCCKASLRNTQFFLYLVCFFFLFLFLTVSQADQSFCSAVPCRKEFLLDGSGWCKSLFGWRMHEAVLSEQRERHGRMFSESQFKLGGCKNRETGSNSEPFFSSSHSVGAFLFRCTKFRFHNERSIRPHGSWRMFCKAGCIWAPSPLIEAFFRDLVARHLLRFLIQNEVQFSLCRQQEVWLLISFACFFLLSNFTSHCTYLHACLCFKICSTVHQLIRISSPPTISQIEARVEWMNLCEG